MLTKYQFHHFDDCDDVIVTVLLPNGEYGAWRESQDEGIVQGFGYSRIGAIADLIQNVIGD